MQPPCTAFYAQPQNLPLFFCHASKRPSPLPTCNTVTSHCARRHGPPVLRSTRPKDVHVCTVSVHSISCRYGTCQLAARPVALHNTHPCAAAAGAPRAARAAEAPVRPRTTVVTAVTPLPLVRCSVRPTGTGARGRPPACPAVRGAPRQGAAGQTSELAPTWCVEREGQRERESCARVLGVRNRCRMVTAGRGGARSYLVHAK